LDRPPGLVRRALLNFAGISKRRISGFEARRGMQIPALVRMPASLRVRLIR
jgi:hypothetical protein